MIVSHKHKFIFIHLGRTGGRALTRALAEHCGEDDIITPVDGVGRNYSGYRRHATSAEIRARIGEDRFADYFKFTIERNPWDKILSRYRDYTNNPRGRLYKRLPQLIGGKPLSFDNWFALRVWQARLLGFGHHRFPGLDDGYIEDGRVTVDFIGRYESLDAHLGLIAQRLGLDLAPLPRIGHVAVARDKPYTDMYSASMRRLVEDLYAQDLALLGYRFGEPHPTDALEFDKAGNRIVEPDRGTD